MFQDIYVATFATYFHDIDDPRVDRTKFHLLHDILVIAICAIICGADGPTAIAQYALDKQDWLKTFLQLPNGVPSHDTIGRVIAQIDPQQFPPDLPRRIVGEEVDPGDNCVGGNDETPVDRTVDQRGVVAEFERARPGQGSKIAPDPLEFAKRLFGRIFCHEAYNSAARQVRARASRTPFASPGSFPMKNA